MACLYFCFSHEKTFFSTIKPYSLGGGGGPKHVLHDLLEVADVLGARTVEVLLDERTHRSESVLQPSLAPLQGPSLVVHIPGVALATEDILRLMSLNWDVRGKTREDATHRQRVSHVSQRRNLNLVLRITILFQLQISPNSNNIFLGASLCFACATAVYCVF